MKVQGSDSTQLAFIYIVLSGLALLFLRWSSTDEVHFVAPYVFTAWGLLIWWRPPTSTCFSIFFFATVFLRFICIGAPLVWSDDAYRYLWEGRMVLEGNNPFVHPPIDFSVQDGVREYVNHPSIPTVYPPLAQYYFALQSWILYQTEIIQVFAGFADCMTACAIWTWLKRSRFSTQGAWMYALHPLPIVECAWSGHLESIALCMTAWGVVFHQKNGRWFWFLSGWIKLFPWVFLMFVKQWNGYSILTMGLVSAVLVYAFWDPSALTGLGIYANNWSYNSSLYALLDALLPVGARSVCLMLFFSGGIWIWHFWKKRLKTIDWVVLHLGMLFVLFSPTVHPWYALWVFVPVVMHNQRDTLQVLVLWCSLIPLTYVSLFTLNPVTGAWSPPLWPTVLSYTIPFGLWLWIRFKKAPR